MVQRDVLTDRAVGAGVGRLEAERRDKSMRSTLSKTSQIINRTAQASLQTTLSSAFERWKRAANGWKGVGGEYPAGIRRARDRAAVPLTVLCTREAYRSHHRPLLCSPKRTGMPEARVRSVEVLGAR